MTGASKLRVAIVTTFYPPHNFGGDGRYVKSFAHALSRAGCEVEVVYCDDGWRVLSGQSSDPPPAEPIDDGDGVLVNRVSSGWAMGSVLAMQQFGRPLLQKKALEKALSRDFDVIHYHNISLAGGPGVLGIGDAIKLYTAHEHWLVCANHVLWRHKRELCDGRECTRCSLAHRRPPPLWRATGLLERESRHVDEFIALSESVAANHKAFGFARDMRLMASFLPDAEAGAAPDIAPHDHPRPYYLMVGRLETIKGMQDVVPLFAKADFPADLLIAGSGPMEEELRSLAGGSANVHFLGQVDPVRLPALYRGARALITPSRCYEVFPMVALEAFREGTPIIARDLGPYPQIVRESGAGMLFDDADSLSDALMRLADDDALRAELSANGRTVLAGRWSEATAMRDWLALVAEIAERRGRPEVAARAGALLAARDMA
ncbi:MAG: glycosyltransferase family 4 protein [Sphingobium sp.]